MPFPVSAYFMTVIIQEKFYNYYDDYDCFLEDPTKLILSNKHLWHRELQFERGKVQKDSMDNYSIPCFRYPSSDSKESVDKELANAHAR